MRRKTVLFLQNVPIPFLKYFVQLHFDSKEKKVASANNRYKVFLKSELTGRK